MGLNLVITHLVPVLVTFNQLESKKYPSLFEFCFPFIDFLLLLVERLRLVGILFYS